MRKGIEGVIEISGLTFYVPIGYYTHEHAFPVEVEVCFKIFVEYPESYQIHSLEDTVSYEPFVSAVSKVLSSPKPLIDQIAFDIKDEFNKLVKSGKFGIPIRAFEVKVEKKEILIPGPASGPAARITISWEVKDN